MGKELIPVKTAKAAWKTELETLASINQAAPIIIDTGFFIYRLYNRNETKNILDYLFNLPLPLLDSEEDFLLNTIRDLTKAYLPSLKHISAEKNFYLTSFLVDELEKQLIGALSSSIHAYSHGKKYRNALFRGNGKYQGKIAQRAKILKNKNNTSPRVIIALKNYRKTLGQIINRFRSDEKILYIPDQHSEVYNLIYEPIQKQAEILASKKKEKKANEKWELEENKMENFEEFEEEEPNNTDQQTLAAAIYASGAREGGLIRIITKDSDYHKLLRNSFKQICRSLDCSGFKNVATAIYFLYINQKEKKITKIITELLWHKSNGRGKGYLINNENSVKFYN